MKFFNNLLREKSTKPNPGLLASAINDHWQPKPRRLMLALEPRIMFDGAAVETAVDTAFDPGSLVRDNAVVGG